MALSAASLREFAVEPDNPRQIEASLIQVARALDLAARCLRSKPSSEHEAVLALRDLLEGNFSSTDASGEEAIERVCLAIRNGRFDPSRESELVAALKHLTMLRCRVAATPPESCSH